MKDVKPWYKFPLNLSFTIWSNFFCCLSSRIVAFLCFFVSCFFGRMYIKSYEMLTMFISANINGNPEFIPGLPSDMVNILSISMHLTVVCSCFLLFFSVFFNLSCTCSWKIKWDLLMFSKKQIKRLMPISPTARQSVHGLAPFWKPMASYKS